MPVSSIYLVLMTLNEALSDSFKKVIQSLLCSLQFQSHSLSFTRMYTNFFFTKGLVHIVVPYFKAVLNPKCCFQYLMCILYKRLGYQRLKDEAL